MYTAIIPDAKAWTLIPIIREKVTPDSIVYTDSFQVYDVLDVSEFHHKRVNHSKTFVSKRGHHINGIENFGNQSTRHLRRFNSIPKHSFYWFLKECEWRVNAVTMPCSSSSTPGISQQSTRLSYISPKIIAEACVTEAINGWAQHISQQLCLTPSRCPLLLRPSLMEGRIMS